MHDRREPAILSFDSLESKAATFEDRLGKLMEAGVRLIPGNRTESYLKALRRHTTAAHPVASVRGREALALMNAVAEVDELSRTAGELLGSVSSEPAWKRRFDLALTGSVHGVASHDPARAAQFELYTAARCIKAGGRPHLEEPDVVVGVGVKTLAIAAKRVLSRDRLEEHVRKARRQIGLTPHGGLIALDLTVAFGLSSKILLATTLEEVERLRRRIFARVDRSHRDVQRWILSGEGGAQVKVVAVYCRWTALDRSTGSTATIRQWLAGPVPAMAYTAAPLKRFVMAFMGKE